MIDHTRRELLRGAGALFLCAPAIERASSLDAIRGMPMAPEMWAHEMHWDWWSKGGGWVIHGYDQFGHAKTEHIETYAAAPVHIRWVAYDSLVANGQHS